MSNLTVYVRNDLKMRKGKMAAQSAHAAMKLLFEMMKRQDNLMVLDSKVLFEFKAFIDNPKVNIVMVKDEAELDSITDKSLPYSIIVDNGRTEFHGVPTKTCAAQGIFTRERGPEMVVPKTYGSEIKAKQIFVFSKEIPLSKEKACELAVTTCLKTIFQKMTFQSTGELGFNLAEDNSMTAWITNAFGKIALSAVNDSSLVEVEQELKEKGFCVVKGEREGNHCLCVEPLYPNQIDPITGNLSLI